MRGFVHFFGLLWVLSAPLAAQLSGLQAESLTLKNGRTLSDVRFQDLTPKSVIILSGQALFSIPLAQLPDPLENRAQTELDHRPEPEPEPEPDSTSGPSWKERRWAEIEANRQAEREIAIARAKNNDSSQPDNTPQATFQPPEWNDLELLAAEFGCDFGIISLRNTGGTSRDLQNWDFEIIYSDGSTLSPRFFRPNRIERESFSEFSFQVPDRGYRIPRYMRFTYGDDRVIPIDRDCLEIDQPRYRYRPGTLPPR